MVWEEEARDLKKEKDQTQKDAGLQDVGVHMCRNAVGL